MRGDGKQINLWKPFRWSAVVPNKTLFRIKSLAPGSSDYWRVLPGLCWQYKNQVEGGERKLSEDFYPDAERDWEMSGTITDKIKKLRLACR